MNNQINTNTTSNQNGANSTKGERFINPSSGWLALFILFILFAVGIAVPAVMTSYYNANDNIWLMVIISFLSFFTGITGFCVVNPNESKVVIFFGKYSGTIVKNGFFFINPLASTGKVSLKARNLNGSPIKVNDKMGNPIMIGIVLVWKVDNTYKASFDVDNYVKYVDIQSEAAIRNLAGSYSYDNIDGENEEVTLRSGGKEVNNELELALSERLLFAGIKVIEARINYLAYAPEIAGAMLQRQQATAIVAARQKIVEGAVSMVQMALEELSDKKIIDLDEEKKAAMVSNLMVVLTSDRAATPVVNAGSLYQ